MVVLAVRSTSAVRLAWTTLLVGFAWWAWMLRWLTPVTGGGYLAFCGYLAVYPAATLLLLRRLGRTSGFSMVLLVPAVWVAAELMRGYVLAGGFGWYGLSHSQAPWQEGGGGGHLIQIADLFGEHGVSFVVAMTNGMLCDLLPPRATDSVRAGLVRSRAASCVVWLLVVVASLLYGRFRLAEAPAGQAGSLRVAVVQTNEPQDNKILRTEANEEALWAQLETLTRRAASSRPGPNLIVWPESTTPAPINDEAVARFQAEARQWSSLDVERMRASRDEETYRRWAAEIGVPLERLPQHLGEQNERLADCRRRIAALVGEVGVPVVVGSMARGFEFPPRRTNSVFLFGADGHLGSGRYEKIHLVPFGEFVPWVGAWPWLKEAFIRHLTPYDHDYTVDRGRDLTVFAVGAGAAEPFRFATPICFEDTVPRLVRRMAYEGAVKRCDMLVNVTNDGWFTGSMQPIHHMQTAVLRCVENRLPMARCVNTGPSGFIDSSGNIGPLARAGGESLQIHATAASLIHRDPRRTLFGLAGHAPMTVTVVLIGLLAAWKGRSRADA
jgi:apolipoprotein N-acyltransferase